MWCNINNYIFQIFFMFILKFLSIFWCILYTVITIYTYTLWQYYCRKWFIWINALYIYIYIYFKCLKTMKTKHTSLFKDIPWKSLSMSCIAGMFLDWNIKLLVKTKLITPWRTSIYQLEIKTDKWPWIREKDNQVVYEDLW